MLEEELHLLIKTKNKLNMMSNQIRKPPFGRLFFTVKEEKLPKVIIRPLPEAAFPKGAIEVSARFFKFKQEAPGGEKKSYINLDVFEK